MVVGESLQKWEERVGSDVLYQIEVGDVGEDGIAHELVMTRWHGYFAERFEVEFWGNKLRVVWKRKNNVFETFKTISEMTYKNSFEEIPWWTDPSEVADMVSAVGAGTVYYLVLDYLKDIFSSPFIHEEG